MLKLEKEEQEGVADETKTSQNMKAFSSISEVIWSTSYIL